MRRIVLTGVTGEIGRGIARRIATRGDQLVLVARPSARLDAAVDELSRLGAAVEVLPADLGDEASVATAADAVRTSPPIHALVHAAGHWVGGTIATTPVSELDRSYRVIVRSAYALVQAAIEPLAAASGTVVFVNSTRIVQTLREQSAYGMSKLALRGFADALRDEVGVRGIRVTTILLGATASELQRRFSAEQDEPYHGPDLLQPDDLGDAIATLLALPRTAEVPDITLRPGIHPANRERTLPSASHVL